jgi:Holliday junction resolvasome RuvABC endonuclease subunit
MILAVDPATRCGWACPIASGMWDLSIRRDESAGMRLIRLRSKLAEIHASNPVTLLVYEAARHAAPKMQGALVVQATLQSVIIMWCEDNGVEYRGYSPSEIKKRATGKGNANKQAVVDAAVQRGWAPRDDNEADALWLLDLAAEQYGDSVKAVPPDSEGPPF